MNEALLRQLAAIVGDKALLTGDDMAPSLTDWRGRYIGRARCVVQPANTEEVAAVVALCDRERVAMVPQGGNTGLCGGATPHAKGDEVIIKLSRMQRIRAIDAANYTITVEAGCVLQAVHEAAAQVDRLFPLSLAAEGNCQIGGNLSTNAGGVNVLRYGTMRELVLGVEAVLPDGRIWHGLRSLRKDNTGYDLKQLLIGAEGTLGIITAAVLKLFPVPRQTATAWVALDSPAAAVALLAQLRSTCGERVSGFEIVGRAALDVVLQHIPGTRDPLPHSAPWYVLVELTETLPEFDLCGTLEGILADEIAARRAIDAVVAQDIAQHKALWRLRESISEAQRIEGVSIKHDIAVPVSRIPEFLARAEEALCHASPGLRIVAFGHIGDGNLHYNLSKPQTAANTEFIAAAPAVNRIVYDLVTSLDGSISAEHGIGQLKRAELARYKSAVELDIMRVIKRTLDPHDLMNPGKIF